MSIAYSIAIIISSILVGATIMAFGEVLPVLREIALNTRHQESKVTEPYKSLPILSAIIVFLGGLVVVCGVIVFVAKIL